MEESPRGEFLVDLERWIEQERAAGHERAFVDSQVRAQATAEALRGATAQQRSDARAAEPTLEPLLAAPAERAAKPAAKPAPAAAPEEQTAYARAGVRRDPEIIARKAAALAELDARQVSVCTKCALHTTRIKTVFGVGHPDADIVFVGEAPGADEDQRGEPFVGRAGQLLTKILQAVGFEREDVFIANVLKCRPPNNRDPLPDEVAHCEPYLLKQLEILEPKIICALGRISAQTLLQTKDSLTALRGQVHDYHGIKMVVTYHPAALLRNPNWKRPTWDDVRRMRQLYDALTSTAAS